MKIRCGYILKQVFDNIIPNKQLEIMRYNNKLKRKMNKSKEDYKMISLKIVLELIPNENIDGKFVNNHSNYDSFHIYFNDNEKEVKRNYIKEKEKISKIKIII